MVDWGSGKVALKLDATITGSSTIQISEWLPLFNNFESTITQNFERIHGAGPGEWNAGSIKKIPTYTFNISVYANEGDLEGSEISSTARLLRSLMISRNTFSIIITQREKLEGIIQETIPVNNSFQLLAEEFSKCYVRSMDVTYDVEEAPIARFECVAYRFEPEVKVDGVSTWLDYILGEGIVQAIDTTIDKVSDTIDNFFNEWET